MNTEHKSPGHERKDVDVISLLIIGSLLLVLGIVIFISISGLMRYFNLHQNAQTSGRSEAPVVTGQNFPEPRLEIEPAANLAKLHAAEDADLNSYEWLDKKTGTVRLPIARAMELLLQRGLPETGAGQTPLSLMQARPLEQATPPRLLENQ